MAKAPFLMGSASSVPSHSRAETSRAVEEGIEIVRHAIKTLMNKPKAERDAYLASMSQDLEKMTDHLGTVDGARAKRVTATKNIIQILEQASSSKQ